VATLAGAAGATAGHRAPQLGEVEAAVAAVSVVVMVVVSAAVCGVIGSAMHADLLSLTFRDASKIYRDTHSVKGHV
jgi:hypothetical protein